MTVDADMGVCSGGAKTHFFSVHQTELIECYSRVYDLDVNIVMLGAQFTTMEWSGSKIGIACEVYPEGSLHTPQSVYFSGKKTSPGQYLWDVSNREDEETVHVS